MQGHWSRDDPSFFLLLCCLLAGIYSTFTTTPPTHSLHPSLSDVCPVLSLDVPECLGLCTGSALGRGCGWSWGGPDSGHSHVVCSCLSVSPVPATSLSPPIHRVVTQYGLKRPGSQPTYVEWSYCFDVHLNALFPLVLCVYGVQIVAWPRELTHSRSHHILGPSFILLSPHSTQYCELSHG